MKNAFVKLTILTILVGVVAVALNTAFNGQVVTYLSTVEYNGIVMKKYDFWAYVQNIQKTFTNTPQLTLALQEREWMTEINLDNWFNVISNNLGFIANILIMTLNLLLYPIRILFYIVQIVLSLLGIPTINGTYTYNPLKWLIDVVKTLTTLQIRYI